MRTKALEDCCSLIVDCPHSTPKWTSDGVVVLRSSNIKDGRLDLSSPSFTDEDHFIERTRRAMPQVGDLIVTREAPMGEVCIIPEGLKCCLGQRQVLLRPKCDSQYLLYAIQSPYIQRQIGGHDATGSTVSNLCIPDLKSIRIPQIANQSRVASVLATIDAKIDLNYRLNQELEGMVQLLYNYWFVQFEFPISANLAASMGDPGLEGKPYRSSGGKMLYNEVLKREIPEEWEDKALGELASVGNETITPSDYQECKFKLYSIPVLDETGTFSTEKGEDIGSNKFMVGGSDLMVSKLNPWFSRVVYTAPELEAICSTEFVVWKTSAREIKAFLFVLACGQHFRTFCVQNATGTSNSHKRVNPDLMMSFSVPYNKEILEEFGNRVLPFLEARQVSQKQNQELIELRDWLLPMLMNGQVTVDD